MSTKKERIHAILEAAEQKAKKSYEDHSAHTKEIIESVQARHGAVFAASVAVGEEMARVIGNMFTLMRKSNLPKDVGTAMITSVTDVHVKVMAHMLCMSSLLGESGTESALRNASKSGDVAEEAAIIGSMLRRTLKHLEELEKIGNDAAMAIERVVNSDGE